MCAFDFVRKFLGHISHCNSNSKVIEYEVSANFSDTFLIVITIQKHIITNVHRYSCKVPRYSCQKS